MFLLSCRGWIEIAGQDIKRYKRTSPVPLKYGKLATKYPWICGQAVVINWL